MVIELKIPNNKIQIPAKFEMRISKYQPAAFVSHIVVLFVICYFYLVRLNPNIPPFPPSKGGNPGKSPFEGGFRGMLSSLNNAKFFDSLDLTM
jgi:hypothetical protein